MKELSAKELVALLLEEIENKKSTIACIGSSLRSDDAAALKLCDILRKRTSSDEILICDGGLENCLDRLIEKKPSRLVILDAAAVDTNEAGKIFLFDIEEISEGAAWSHRIPISMALKILSNSILLDSVILIGIGGERFDIGEELSPSVEKLINYVDELLGIRMKTMLELEFSSYESKDKNRDG
ncbi:MAG: hydrogenase maturation protease [Fervidicoccaceae archaeon]